MLNAVIVQPAHSQCQLISVTLTHIHSLCWYIGQGGGGISLPPRRLPAAVFVAATVCITFLQENREFSWPAVGENKH